MTKETIRQSLASRLIAIRNAAGQTQGDVAVFLGIKKNTYQAYEEQRAIPPLSVLIQLRDYYGFSTLDELMGLCEPEPMEKKLTAIQEAYQKAHPDVRHAISTILKIGNAK